MMSKKEIQPFTDEQEEQIEKVIDPYYERVIKATSILTLLKVYHRQREPNKVHIQDVNMEYILQEVDDLLQPVQDILAEVGSGAWYLLDERALKR